MPQPAAGAAAEGSAAEGPSHADPENPAATFWIDMARFMVELLNNSRSIARSLTTTLSDVNTSADTYEAILSELTICTADINTLRQDCEAMKAVVKDLRQSMSRGSPEARSPAGQLLVWCRVAYAATLTEIIVKAGTTSHVGKGPMDTTAVVHSVVAETLGLSIKDAEEMGNGKRETSRHSSKDVVTKRATTKSVPTVKLFNNRLATFYWQLGEAAVNASKERVDVPTDPDDVLADAVAWLNLDKYLMTPEGLAGICIATRGMAHFIGCQGSFAVDAVEVGNICHVHAFLGHVSFASTNLYLRGPWQHWCVCRRVHGC